jgi:Family of unknown function (DUF5990)
VAGREERSVRRCSPGLIFSLLMVNLTISVQDIPTECFGFGAIQLVLQTKKEYVMSSNGVFSVQLDRAKNRKGEEHWVGESVVFHGDGRRFIYLAWLDFRGKMFRRIKLYLDQIPGLSPDADSVAVTIRGRGKDGSPACSTAVIA